MVLDPKRMKQRKTILQDSHKSYLMLMNAGINDCWDKFSNKKINKIDNWECEYIDVIGGESNRYCKELSIYI